MKIDLTTSTKALLFTGMIVMAQNAVSAELMVYPAKGQSADQMSRDRYECHMWAVQQSGFDPTTSQPSSSGSSGSVAREGLRGGARGAAAGAAIGAIAGDAGKGAAIGATAGALKRGFNQHDSNKSSASAPSQGSSDYQRAQAVCLEGRGYSVK